jgi:DNA-binding transcriptional regulator YhcF (GntR family)
MPQSSAPESDLACKQIKSLLSQRLGKQWTAGMRLPPIRQLARQLKAGQRNTHRAVQELVVDGLLTSAPRRGTFVARTKHVYMPMSEAEGMSERMAAAFLAQLQQLGVRVTRGPDIKHWDLTGVDADAVALIQRNSTEGAKVRPGQIVTLINTHDARPQMMDGRFDVVTVDQFHGSSLAGKFLRQRGIDSVCYIGTGKSPSQEYFALDSVRLSGLEAGIGFKLPRRHRLMARRYTEEAGAEMARVYLQLDPRPRAVFAVCDEIAIGFLLGARALGLVAGEDYDLIGFDGQWRGRNLSTGPLVSVAVPSEEMGRTGAQLLAARLETPDLPPRIVQLGCSIFQGSTVRGEIVTPERTR